MSVIYTTQLIVFLTIIQSSFSERRIKDGFEVQSDKKYVVYLLKAASSPRLYTGWTCGGAIVSPSYVLTAAACVEDLHHVYVIPGYKKFVADNQIEQDDCTKNKKKKVVLTCIPKSYKFDYNKTELWSNIDIALVKVESPFDFTDKSYETQCSYIPEVIDINFEPRYQSPGLDAMALGWGHAEIWRSIKDEASYNQAVLHYAPTKIMEKHQCMTYFDGNSAIPPIIEKYMICTLEAGNIDDKGNLLVRSEPVAEGCITKEAKLRGMPGVPCEDSSEIIDFEGAEKGRIIILDPSVRIARRQDAEEEPATYDQRQAQVDGAVVKGGEGGGGEGGGEGGEGEGGEGGEGVEGLEEEEKGEKAPGICQNDHGGPLVTWVGAHEVVIGVATMFKLDSNQKCEGPYLFTSTQCNSAFLDCILHPPNQNDTEGRRRCDHPEDYKVIRRSISWVGHPDGPAENEMIFERPQVPLRAFQPRYV